MMTVIIIVATILLMVLIWFVFFTNNDMVEDDGLSSIVNFEMPKLFKQEDEKLGFWSSRKASKQSESESLKSLRGEMLGKKKSLSSLEQEISDVQDIRNARTAARRDLENKRTKCMGMADEVLQLQDKLGIPPDEAFDDNI